MDSPHSRYPHVFAVVRFDLPINAVNILDSVSVVKVFTDAEPAESGAARLTRINDESKCIYQVQTTRFIAEGMAQANMSNASVE